MKFPHMLFVGSIGLAASIAAAGPTSAAAAEEPIDLGDVTEKQVMIPMRDGASLSAYLYIPSGDGPWPVLYEQRYADLRRPATRRTMAQLASAGYVVALENFRGAVQN